jgi:hypothetical protein
MRWARRSSNWTIFSAPWARARAGHEVVDLAVGRLALHDAEENPNEVAAALDDKTEAVIRELEAQHKEARRSLRRRWEGHLRSPEKTYQDLMSWLERLSTGQVASVERPTLAFPLPEAGWSSRHVPRCITAYAKKCRSELCRNCVRSPRKYPRAPTFTGSHQEAFCGGKSLNRLREEMFRYHSMELAGIVFQACSFNHSDISPFKWNQQFTGRRRSAQNQTVT